MYNTHWVVLYLRISNITKKKKKNSREENELYYIVVKAEGQIPILIVIIELRKIFKTNNKNGENQTQK